jgi:hypothetical protein
MDRRPYSQPVESVIPAPVAATACAPLSARAGTRYETWHDSTRRRSRGVQRRVASGVRAACMIRGGYLGVAAIGRPLDLRPDPSQNVRVWVCDRNGVD